MTTINDKSVQEQESTSSVVSDDMLIILPVRNLVLFPGVALPVAVKRDKTLAGAQEAIRAQSKVGFLLQKSPETEDPGFDDLHRIGTAATVARFVTTPDGTHHLVCQGQTRFRVVEFLDGYPYLAARIERLARGLRARGLGPVISFDLRPNDGSAPIETLARQVETQVDALCAAHSCRRVDLIGFSMGALVSRYFLQRLDGKARARRFVSISGPHAGTLSAYGLPLTGARQMRPGSALLRELASDPDPFGEVEVHCVYTPWDLMIVPARSSILPGAQAVHAIPVPLHRWMLTDPRVLDCVASALG